MICYCFCPPAGLSRLAVCSVPAAGAFLDNSATSRTASCCCLHATCRFRRLCLRRVCLRCFKLQAQALALCATTQRRIAELPSVLSSVITSRRFFHTSG